MKIWIIDSEANSLYPDKFWCVVFKAHGKNDYKVFVNDTYFTDVCNYISPGKHLEIVKLSQLSQWVQDEVANTSARRFVGHNSIAFDFFHIKRVLGVDLFEASTDLRDTLILSKLANPRRAGGHSIKNWGVQFGLAKTEIEDEQWASFDPIMLERCISDIEIGERVYDHLRLHELRGFSLQSVELEHNTQVLIAQQQRDGVFVDEKKVHELYTTTKFHADHLQNEIRKAFPKRSVLVREYNPKLTKSGVFARNTCGPTPYDQVVGPYSLFEYEEFNIGSPKQVLERLLEVGWKPTTFSKKTKNPTVAKDAFDNLPPDAPKEAKLIGTYRLCRSRQNLAEQIMEARDAEGYLHGYVDILGAGTHRMASNSPNLQNIPSTKEDKVTKESLTGLKGKWGWECRDLFCVQDKTRNVFVDVDASGIQLRALAHYGKDAEYIKFVSDPKIDIHDVHAQVLECSRSVAKTFIYAFLMGAGVRKLVFVLGGNDVEKGKALLEKFYQRFPFLRTFKEELDKEVERGYHIALDGRLIGLDKDAPHKAMAVALQSFEAIIMKTALVLYQKTLKQNNCFFVQRLMVHDEFLTETKRELKDVVGTTMAQSIVKAGEIYDCKCPLDGKYKTGVTWAECH